ncbi:MULTISPECIES: hypothetical protein [Nocardioides]|uniref:Uncharacterized protein n=1 Tax=Nocardioides vastitatis TaxID=2568655 RepID=A0ABW0ZI79_9ACTN|nr:hypothetical protein [Nocardioides sp.]THJ04279.1 hypothetical protein E7Z54_08660 [Nocardioides sp.]
MSSRPDLALLSDFVPPWTPEQVAALDDWRQGDLLPCPPLIWSTTATSPDPVTGQPAQDGGLVPWPSPLPKYGIITSQTCDVCAKGPGERAPFVQVSPVVQVADATRDQWNELVAGQIVDRYGLTGKKLRSKWAADLRVSFPVSKAVLLGATPVRGFATPEQAVEFGAHLAHRAGRPALHDFFLDVVQPDIEAAIKASAKKGTGWWSKVEEVRLDIRGDDLAPKFFRLVVVTSSVLSPDEHDQWIQLGVSFKKRARAQGIKIGTTVVSPIDDLAARVYRDTVELSVPSLRR